VDVKPGRIPKIVEGKDLERLILLRKQRGLSIRELEEEFECSRMAVWRALSRAEGSDWDYEYCRTLV
jgi:hypothetical protein